MNFKNAEEKKTSPFLSPGSGIVLKINNITLDKSQNTQNLRPVFFMETEPINDPSFQGADGAKGKVGKVSANAGYYLKTDNNVLEFLGSLKSIARAIGKEGALDNLEAPDLPALLEQVVPILSKSYASYFIAGKEFPKPGGKYGIKLVFPNRNFVEAVGTEPTSLAPFDRTNPKHYTKLPEPTEPAFDTSEKTPDDLPF